MFTFLYYYFRHCHSGHAEEKNSQLTIFLVSFALNKSIGNIKLVGNALWAWALAFTFLCLLKAPLIGLFIPLFLRENLNGLKVGLGLTT